MPNRTVPQVPEDHMGRLWPTHRPSYESCSPGRALHLRCGHTKNTSEKHRLGGAPFRSLGTGQLTPGGIMINSGSTTPRRINSLDDT